jgi:DNA-binding transcriptional regulator PaaX
MFVKGHPPYYGPGRPKGSLNQRTIEAKALARGLLNDPTYRKNLQADLKNRKVEASIEAMLWHYAYGKPKEHVEVHWNLEKLTDMELDQLEAIVKRVS